MTARRLRPRLLALLAALGLSVAGCESSGGRMHSGASEIAPAGSNLPLPQRLVGSRLAAYLIGGWESVDPPQGVRSIEVHYQEDGTWEGVIRYYGTPDREELRGTWFVQDDLVLEKLEASSLRPRLDYDGGHFLQIILDRNHHISVDLDSGKWWVYQRLREN
ncbi:MAG: hypothetical protein EA425_08070 [Puniceicoccaceae bacterium]|nr:MAG: hypothetical protein EA425_08070 [Puniceicoccaceae bacterium]